MHVRLLWFLIGCWLLMACSQQERAVLPVEGNAVYYWRTTFTLDSMEQAFLDQYQIRRIYCRYFDVVNQSGPMPNATIRFDQVPSSHIEIVPTVFIMNECMQQRLLTAKDGTDGTDRLAEKIVSRVVQMNETHDLRNVREIQIDCDYTARNRELYYQFLTSARKYAKAHGLGLSVTIRLHQLSMPAPPADYGVLMLYNTGAPERFAERNPILDLRDVRPYVRYLEDYPLPMGAAYPVFLWQRTLHGVNIEHVADYDAIKQTKQLVEAERDDLRRLILVYHLENENIQRYEPKQYEEIFNHDDDGRPGD